MTQPRTFHDLIGHNLGTQDVAWTERDAILYALACGAKAEDLDLVYERDLRPLPGLVSALGLWAVERCGDLGVYDRKKSLHVSQGLTMHAPMARSATLATRAASPASGTGARRRSSRSRSPARFSPGPIRSSFRGSAAGAGTRPRRRRRGPGPPPSYRSRSTRPRRSRRSSTA